MMGTISAFMMGMVLQHLDAALAETRKATPASHTIESNATWRIVEARRILLGAALADIAVESVSVVEPLRMAA